MCTISVQIYSNSELCTNWLLIIKCHTLWHPDYRKLFSSYVILTFPPQVLISHYIHGWFALSRIFIFVKLPPSPSTGVA